MTHFRDTTFAAGRVHSANLPRGLRRFAAASAFLTCSRRSCSSRYSFAIEQSNSIGTLGFVWEFLIMKIEALFSAKNHRLEMFDRGSATATREMSGVISIRSLQRRNECRLLSLMFVMAVNAGTRATIGGAPTSFAPQMRRQEPENSSEPQRSAEAMRRIPPDLTKLDRCTRAEPRVGGITQAQRLRQAKELTSASFKPC